jgi:hypothetical protein
MQTTLRCKLDQFQTNPQTSLRRKPDFMAKKIKFPLCIQSFSLLLHPFLFTVLAPNFSGAPSHAGRLGTASRRKSLD